jgi:hypothetical protein
MHTDEIRSALKPNKLRLAIAAMVSASAIAAAPAVLAEATDPGRYTTGDFHNHTTCSDGQISIQRLVNKSVDTYGLDWFILADHGGNGNRNCTLPDDLEVAEQSGIAELFPFVPGQGPATTWADSGQAGNIINTASTTNMARWQAVADYNYPVVEAMSRAKSKPIWVGIESVVAGHEHSNMAVNDGQLINDGLPVVGSPRGNAEAVAQWEYCFDRAYGDLSRGGPTRNWDCSVPGSELNEFLDPVGLKLFGTSPNGQSWNTGTTGHRKTLEGLRWLQAYYPDTSYYIPAHMERAGIFDPNANRGFNIEHFRNFNNVAPSVAFGFEGGPGHQASGGRSYSTNSAGGDTYGGQGYYAGKLGGVWDALLGEGRNWWIFNNSDYHNRGGGIGPDDPRSTNDQYPGEYNQTYVIAKTGDGPLTTEAVVNGMRSGNAYYVNGDIINRMSFVVCVANGRSNAKVASQGNAKLPHENQIADAAEQGIGFENPNCAQQGEKLVIKPGQSVQLYAVMRDPEGPNNSVYTLPNPSLLQVGIEQPLNEPVLDHVDVITGVVTGYVSPDSADYAGVAPGGSTQNIPGVVFPGQPDDSSTMNPSTSVVHKFNSSNWEEHAGGWRRMFLRMDDIQASQYVRLRGTNMPEGVPFETDADGEPLRDRLAENITVFPQDFDARCSDPAQAPTILNCLTHLASRTVDGKPGRILNNDVEAFADLWFLSNPIYIEVKGGVEVAGVK